jgi:hypothetical protein
MALTHGVHSIGHGHATECGQLVQVFRVVWCTCACLFVSDCCVHAMQGERVCIRNESLAAISSHLGLRHVAVLMAELWRPCFSCAVLGVRMFAAEWLNTCC